MKVVLAAAASLLFMGALGLGSGARVAATFDQYGHEELAAGVLEHPSITLLPGARRDVEEGLIDGRVLGLLLILAESHELTRVGPLISGHSYYVKGTARPSNHAFGRAVDILAVDGTWVTARNLGALDIVEVAGSLEPPLRPDQIGAPWPLDFPGIVTFTKDHYDHLHFGYGRKP